jgi:hypothetical protein
MPDEPDVRGVPEVDPPTDRPDPRRLSSPYVREALAVSHEVVEESGRFAVYLDIVLDDGAVRRRVGEYPDRARAEQAAMFLERSAERHLGPL